MKINEQLLEKVRGRQKKTEHNYGILTADRYVKTLEECVGSDLCYRYGSKGMTSFDDVLQKAAKTLTYNNPDMVLQEVMGVDYKYVDKDGDELSLPKNTLMVFRHTLTTPKKDRDGDILRTEGAQPDLKMLLLWQHVPTLPIGKLLRVHEHTKDRLVVDSAIIDINELAHDSVVMVDNGMGRFSHGFQVVEYEDLKGESGNWEGFDIKVFGIMEESLVSIPSNTDAETQEILVDLVEAGKLKSGIVRELGKTYRSKMATRIPVEVDVKLLINGKEGHVKGSLEDVKPHKLTEKAPCGCQDKSATPPEKADGTPQEEQKSADQKIYVGCVEIEGSWEWTEMKLGKRAKAHLLANDIDVEDKYVFLAATFADHAILGVDTYFYGSHCDYYRCSWGMEEGVPVLKGNPVEVEIELSAEISEKLEQVRTSKAYLLGEKAGKILSKQTATTLTDVKDDITEVLEKEEDLSRGSKSILKGDIKSLEELLNKDEEGEGADHESKETSPEEAMAVFLAKSSRDLRQRMVDTILSINRAEQKAHHREQYRRLTEGLRIAGRAS